MSQGAATAGPFLAALSEDDAGELRALGRVRRYDAGDVLFSQGDEAGRRAHPREGCVKVTSLRG